MNRVKTPGIDERQQKYLSEFNRRTIKSQL